MLIRELLENQEEPGYTDNDLARFLRQHCLHALTQFDTMWRGLTLPNDVYKVAEVDGEKIFWTVLNARAYRSPSDSLIEIHEFADMWFQQHFGWRARSQGTFVTGRKTEAAAYGHPHLIFPVGEFDYIWSPKIHDLYTAIPQTVDVDQDEVYKILGDGDYQDANLNQGLRKGNEVMLKCKSYVAIRHKPSSPRYGDPIDAMLDHLK